MTIFKSQNDDFDVSGSWTNPNVTAQFLAMTLPVFLFLVQSKFKKIVQLSLLIVIIAIGLLKCRSAYIGAVVSVIVYYALHYNFVNWFKNPKNRNSTRALLIITLLLIIPVTTQLYQSKKASADGRQFIWKLSTLMFIQKPLTGYGYGSFSKEFNLFQSKYIENGKATLEEQTNAGPTIVAHNELLQNAVEGGIVGLVLFLFFWGSLLFSIKQKNKEELDHNSLLQPKDIANKNNLFHLAYAAVLGFMAMSLFNFTIQAIPVMTLFTIYVAIICSQLAPITITKFFSFLNSRWVKTLTNGTIFIVSVYLLFVLVNIANADSLNQDAAEYKKQGQIKKALQIMPKLEPWLNEESNYWKNYGNLLFLDKNFQAALRCLEKAKQTSSKPELYMGSGVCFEKMGKYPNAIEQYNRLVFLHPSKFKYRFQLLTAYLHTKDTANVVLIAQSIIDLKPKIPSIEVVRYKKMAEKIRFAFDKNFKNNMTNHTNFSLNKNQFNFQK